MLIRRTLRTADRDRQEGRTSPGPRTARRASRKNARGG
jgi:hypothetical protein